MTEKIKNPNELELVFINLLAREQKIFSEEATILEMQNLAYAIDKLGSSSLQKIKFIEAHVDSIILQKRKNKFIGTVKKTFKDLFFTAIRRHYNLHTKYMKKSKKLNYNVEDHVLEFKIEIITSKEYKKFLAVAEKSEEYGHFLSILKFLRNNEYDFPKQLSTHLPEYYGIPSKDKTKNHEIRLTLHTIAGKFDDYSVVPLEVLEIFTEAKLFGPENFLAF